MLFSPLSEATREGHVDLLRCAVVCWERFQDEFVFIRVVYKRSVSILV